MDKFFINGGNCLKGEIKIDCAKNSLLPILAGCILVNGQVLLKNVPKYKDVSAMCDILLNLGGFVKWQGDDLLVDCSQIDKSEISNELASVVRSSIFTLGPILSRLGCAKVAYPGGCDIGLRPIDIHLNGLKELGCKIVEKNGYIYGQKLKRNKSEIMLKFPSVGATENLLMFASLFEGRTVIYNAAKEPEIVDLACFLNKCGAKIDGAGSDIILVEGVKNLHGCEHQAIPDRIEAGTFLIAGAICNGNIYLKNAIYEHNSALIDKLEVCGCKVLKEKKGIRIIAPSVLESFGDIETAVYPGFPTDLQPQMATLGCVCNGCSLIFENVFESRFNYVGQLLKMGADIKFKSSICIIRGKRKLYGADVWATDLRGGAALVLAGLFSEGYTTVDNIGLIDRGYFKLEEKLVALGGDIKRI